MAKKERSTVAILLGDLASTTWRMFIPVIIGLLAGDKIDTLVDIRPIGLILGIIIGTAIAGLLVKRQLDKV